MTRGRIVVLALAVGASSEACDSRKGVPVSGAGAGGKVGLPGTGTGGQGAGTGGTASGAPSDGGAGLGQTGGAVASGGAPGGGGSSKDAGSSGAGGNDGAGGAGGTPKVMEPYFRAGTRLKPRVFQMGDLQVLDRTDERGWVDKETGVACLFRVGADGIERCLPSQGAGGFYSDARCSKPVVIGPQASSGQTTSQYVTIAGSSSCNDHAHRVDTSRSGTGPVYYVNDNGSCAKHVDRVSNGEAVYPLVEVPLNTFVAVKRVSRPRAPHMDALVREGEDGSSEVVGFVDPGRKQPCFALGLNVSPPLCVPGWQRASDVFDGPDCTRLVAFDESASTCPTRPNAVLLKVDRDDLSCRDQSIAGVWEVAGTVRTPIFVKENGTCALNGDSAVPVEVLAAGAPINVASLPKLEIIDVGNSPLRVRFYGFDGVPFLPAPRSFEYLDTTGPFIDAATGEWCDPNPFADDQWRCVPLSFESVMDFHVLFASADCTGTRLFESTSLPFCSDKARKPRGMVVKTLVRQVDAYDRIVDTFEVTGTVSPSVVSTGPPSSRCTTVGNGGSYYEANKALNPADVFVSLERKMSD